MGDATGPATPGSSDAPGDCTPRCGRPPRPRRTTRQQTTTEMSETSYGTAQAGAQTLAAGSLRDFRVPFVPESACRWPQVFHTQAIRLRPMTLFNPVFNCLTPKGIKRSKTQADEGLGP